MLNKWSIPLRETTIAAGASFECVLDLRNCKYKRLLIIQDWLNGTSAGVTGLELSVLAGFGAANGEGGRVVDPVELAKLKFATLDPSVIYQPQLAQPPLALPPAASPINQYNTFISLDWENNSRFPKLHFKNLDAALGMVLLIWGDE